jgi:chemotaxis family two-component system response regulator Rcp1
VSEQTVGRPMELLLVEDSLSDVRITMHALEQGNISHRLTIARTGEEALEFLNRRGIFARAPRPDLILLDLRLPKMDGQEVLDSVKADFDLKDIPVVVMTMSADEEDRLRCQLHHVDAYVTKPVDLEKFLDLVRDLKHHWHKDMTLPNQCNS